MRPAVALPVPAIAVVASFSAAVLTTILAAGGGVQALSVPGRFVGAFAPAHSPLCSPPSTRRDPRFVSSVSPLYSSYGGVSPPPPYSDGPEGGIGSEATPSTPEATPFGGDPWIDESVLSAPDSTSSPCVIKVRKILKAAVVVRCGPPGTTEPLRFWPGSQPLVMSSAREL